MTRPTPRIDAIVTARLVLRTPRPADAGAIVPLANNLRVTEMLARLPYPYGASDAHDFLRTIDPDNADRRVFAVTLIDDGAFVGGCGLERDDADAPYELGYWLGEPYWGKGYATEAARALVDLAFGAITCQHLVSQCRPMNRGSRHVLEKCGFHFAGTGMMNSRALGKAVPVDHCSLDHGMWLAGRLASAGPRGIDGPQTSGSDRQGAR